MSRIPQQLELPLNRTREATPLEYQKWREEDYWNKMDFDPLLMFVVIPSIIQLSAVGFMLLIFWINSIAFS
jgi:hypothetical protein